MATKKAQKRATETPGPPEWVDGNRAAQILGVGRYMIPRLAAEGRIGVRDLPVRAKYRRADVVRLAASCIRPATAAMK
jgi:hypothetical protein